MPLTRIALAALGCFVMRRMQQKQNSGSRLYAGILTKRPFLAEELSDRDAVQTASGGPWWKLTLGATIYRTFGWKR